jgi:hypothetical protein
MVVLISHSAILVEAMSFKKSFPVAEVEIVQGITV